MDIRYDGVAGLFARQEAQRGVCSDTTCVTNGLDMEFQKFRISIGHRSIICFHPKTQLCNLSEESYHEVTMDAKVASYKAYRPL